MHAGKCRVLLFFIAVCAGVARAEGDGADFFEKSVRPLLAQQCFTCHSAASRPVMGGLRLDSREGIEKGGELRTTTKPTVEGLFQTRGRYGRF